MAWGCQGYTNNYALVWFTILFTLQSSHTQITMYTRQNNNKHTGDHDIMCHGRRDSSLLGEKRVQQVE